MHPPDPNPPHKGKRYAMQGLMQDWPLLVPSILDHARLYHPEREVVSRSVEGPIHRYTYGDMHGRAKRCAKALTKLGVRKGQVVATLAWNTYRHMEAWYGIMGLGAVCHTLNPRLFPEQLVYIVNHAEDQYLFTDLTFVPLVAAIQDKCPKVKGVIVMTDRAHMPEPGKLRNAICFEDLLADSDPDIAWAKFGENTACGLCYTSGTTGNPKGVLYSHRSNVLHALMAGQADAQGLRNVDVVLPIVPMFHANAWALAFAAPMSGTKLVMPGPKLDGASVCELLETEKITMSAAVPTVWLGLLQYLEQTGKTLPHLKRVVIGGSACPRSMIETFETKYDVEVVHAWGMTEMSPLGTLGSLKSHLVDLPYVEKLDIKCKQGHPPFGVEMKIVDDKNKELPRDGKTFGRLKVRGPAIAKGYFKGDGKSSF